MTVQQDAVADAIASRRTAGRIRDLVALTKPRVMSLVMFTATVGYVIAPGKRGVLKGL